MNLKQLFFEAIDNGELGAVDDLGVIVTLSELEQRFTELEPETISHFLPSATLENGQREFTAHKFLYQIKDGVYRVHPDALDQIELLFAEQTPTLQ